MASVTLAQALADLGRLVDSYDAAMLDYNRQLFLIGELGQNTQDDEFAVANAGALVLDGQAALAGQFDLPLGEILRQFQSIIGTSASNIDTLLNRIEEYQRANSLSVKSLGVAYTSVTESFTGVGDQVLYVNSKSAGDYVNEAVTIETLKFECLRQAESERGRGAEQYFVTGGGRAGKSEFDGPGVGIVDSTLVAYEPGVAQNQVKNPSFDLPLVGTGTDKVQFWTIESGESNIARVTTPIAKDRGGSHAALRITGTCKIRFYFRRHNVVLNRDRPYIAGFRIRGDSSSAGTIVARVGSAAGTAWFTGNIVPGVDAAFENVVLPYDVDEAWADVFDTDGDPFFEIECTVAPSGGNAQIFIDDVLFRPMARLGGRHLAIVSGMTDAVKGDVAEQECTLTPGVGSVELDSGASGSLNSIEVDGGDALPGVSLLSGPIPFNGTLAQTALDAIADINSRRTFPNYIAFSGGSGVISFRPEVPREGTFTVTSDATTIATTDTNISGAVFGKWQNFLVRRRGKALKHAGSPSSGWS